MQQKEQAGQALSTGMMFLIGIAVGIILIIIGVGTDTEGVFDAGVAITTLALFGGAFMLKDIDGYMRLGLLIAGGWILANLAGVGSILAGSPY